MTRRDVLRGGVAGLAALMGKGFLAGCGDDASDSPGPRGGGGADDGGRARGADGGLRDGGNGDGGAGRVALALGPGPALVSRLGAIGPLGDPDADGVRVPAGFRARIVARAGEAPVPGGAYRWHVLPDGGATFATDDDGWVYVSNSEMLIVGGVGALRFDRDGEVVDAYRILGNTSANCAGGKMPWGVWLSCEEFANGRVHECDPLGVREAIVRPALGVFKHEAAAYDPVNHHVYLTEDESDGRLYRYVPRAMADGHADLTKGQLQACAVDEDGAVTWHDVPDPGFEDGTPTRRQVAASTAFDGGEGLWFQDGVVYFSTKGDNRVRAYDIEKAAMRVLYDAKTAENSILTGVDNLTGTCCGDILVAEDHGDMQIVAILADGTLRPLVQVVGQDDSEVTGPAFDPSGTRLYFSSQRAPGSGWTFEVTGPFHAPA
jgi:hypothetical protein